MAADLADAVRTFPLTSWLSGHTQVKDSGGANLYATCVVCQGREKLFVRKETGKWRCFRCDEGGHGGEIWRGWGNLFGLVMHLERLNYPQAIQFVVSRSGFPDLKPVRPDVPYHKIPQEAMPLSDFPKDHMAWTRLAERKLTHLGPRIYGQVSGRYPDRWILPCKFLGKLEGFEAKSWYPNVKPKALYEKWFITPDTVYTTEDFDCSLGFAVMTESIFDAETFRKNACGLYGSNFLPGQFDKLLELKARGVEVLYWALDPDAWQKQAKAIVQKTSAVFKNYVLNFPRSCPNGDKPDPNGIGTVACWELVGRASPVDSELDTLDLEGL